MLELTRRFLSPNCRQIPSTPTGGGRVLKTLQCVHDQGGLVVVKVPLIIVAANHACRHNCSD